MARRRRPCADCEYVSAACWDCFEPKVLVYTYKCATHAPKTFAALMDYDARYGCPKCKNKPK